MIFMKDRDFHHEQELLKKAQDSSYQVTQYCDWDEWISIVDSGITQITHEL